MTPVLEALHQSVRRRRTSTKGKGKEVSMETLGDEENGEKATVTIDDEELRASDMARKRRRLSTTPTPRDEPRTPSNVEMRVQHTPQRPLTVQDEDVVMEDNTRRIDKTSGDQAIIPSPSAASSDFLWGSLGEIDPEVLALLNASDSAALGIFQGDPNAPSMYVSREL